MENLKPIRVFLEVAEQLSFSGAARALKMTPASVTRIIAALETDIGQQLLVRTTRNVALTSAGAMVAARFGPVVQAFDQAAEEVTRAAKSDHGRLRVNAPLSFGIRILPDLMEAFRIAYPRIDLEVHLTDTLVDIMSEDCDLAIRVSRPPSDKSTIWRKLCEVPRHLIAAPSLFERVPQPQSPDDLSPELMLSYGAEGRAETWEFRKAGIARTVKAGSRLISNNGDFLYGVTCRGGGICVLPDFIVRPGIDAGDVVPVIPDWSLPSFWLTLYYPPYEQLPPLVATFTDFFETYIRDVDGLVF